MDWKLKQQRIFFISLRTYNRIKEDQKNTLVETKYTLRVSQTRVSKEQLEEVQRILEDILPKQSGEWRLQEATDKKIYETYCTEIQKGSAVSKTFFIYNILAKERIHHSKRPKFCHLCKTYKDGDKSENILEHQSLIPIQRGQYSLEKNEIGSGKTPTTALVTQDFTQITFEGGFSQDLIGCIYT